ncbi:retrovirus-related pol polyprotein from transposon TNT 1-94 [Tanacetum coccineum]|uniref:Retrovirus-related pol polyprotein from transposon TNT 1-94 n=1 Tax=Tanacetum coccineum TaxID=301880 RepID=A0ABQ4XZQ0_9ASTR
MEIIKRVPDVKSLIRFRAVSKPWKSFVDSPEFITGYSARDTHPHRLLLRYRDNVHPYEFKYVSFVDMACGVCTVARTGRQQRWLLFGTHQLGNPLDRIVGNHGVWEIKNFILSFDLITHEFKQVNLPHSLANQLSQNFSISKLRESLVVSAYTNEVNDGRVYGVWMIGEEGGVMTSFKKLFNIKTPDVSPASKVLGFTMSGEPIMETETDDKEVATVEVYKPCSEHIKDLEINGENGSFFIFHYTETLLLGDHSDCCIISNDS